jgi:23S rRNA (uracil1939-C5)-methyltransferase
MNKNVKLDTEINTTTAQVHALSHDGRGIATINHKTTFLTGALPGETVRYKINQKRGSYNEGEATEIITPSPERVTPPCPHFNLCGGCSLQHMSVSTQIDLKTQTMLDQLKHFGQVTPVNLLPPLSALQTGYRRKARLGAKFVIKKDQVFVGFREKKSHYLADIQSCAVLYPAVGERLLELRALIASLEQYRHIPQIEVAIGDTTVALVFRHMEDMSASDQAQLIAFGQKHQFHIYLQPNPPGAVKQIWPEQATERLTYSLPDQHLEFLFHPLDFTQINLEMNRLMVNQALQLLDVQSHETVLDLFCGIGNFTLPLARQAQHVVGVEGGSEMVERGNANAAHNGINNVTFYSANLMEPPINAPWIKQPYDKILLDPPRAGAKEILPFFEQFSAKRIVYVSCNPATLARDAGELVHKLGYQLQYAGIMNMFPHTAHIEAMAVFDKV